MTDSTALPPQRREGPDRRHRRWRRAHGGGHRALGGAALRRHGPDRHGATWTRGASTSPCSCSSWASSAGGLIISSIPRAFGRQGFGGISKVAVWTSICCTVLAICFVVVDLGQPLRVWELFAYSNPGFASHVGHRRPFRIPYPFGGLPLGDASRRSRKGVAEGSPRRRLSWSWCAPSSTIR